MTGQRHVVQARRIRLQGIRAGLTVAEIADDLRQSCKLSELAVQRLARGWTLSQAAERLNAFRRHDGQAQSAVTVQMLCAWERDRGRPSLASADLLRRLYQARPDQLGFVPDY